MIGCVYKSNALLRLFERLEVHGVQKITDGTTTAPVLNAPQFTIVMELLRRVAKFNEGRGPLLQPWQLEYGEWV